MKKYYIQLKKNDSKPLKKVIQDHMKLSELQSEKLILQGSVWDKNKKKRLKNPNAIITTELLQVFKPATEISEYRLLPEQLLYEDKNFMAVFKPGGVPVQGTPEADIHSLLYGVNRYLKENNLSYGPQVIHRLDTPTAGLVLFAKNKAFEKKLHALFRERKIKKFYLSVCPIAVKSEKTLVFEDVLDNGKKKQKARSLVRFLKNVDEDKQVFLVQPETGRFHQIRKHFSSYLKPISGDKKYGSKIRGKLKLLCIGYRFPKGLKGFPSKIIYIPEDFCIK